MRALAYAVLGVGLVVAFDPRTWGATNVPTHGGSDGLGVILAGEVGASLLFAILTLAVVVLTVESLVRARAPRRSDEEPNRSWYD